MLEVLYIKGYQYQLLIQSGKLLSLGPAILCGEFNMSINHNQFCLYLLIFYVCGEFVYTSENLQVSYVSRNVSTETGKQNEKLTNLETPSYISSQQVDQGLSGLNQNNDKVIPILIRNHLDRSTETIKTRPSPNKSEIVLEGGDTIQQRPVLPSNQAVEELNTDGSHQKGSKGRKGVQFPGSSVVPRKGVGQQVASHVNDTNPKTNPLSQKTEKESTIHQKSLPDLGGQSDKQNQSYSFEEIPHKVPVPHAKKPDFVTDVGEMDDFDTYLISKTSTSGEDYVIIGVVIVVGIWFSVFGALIFYRRAGEYWDRRHYRRMDFLVEGMYND